MKTVLMLRDRVIHSRMIPGTTGILYAYSSSSTVVPPAYVISPVPRLRGMLWVGVLPYVHLLSAHDTADARHFTRCVYSSYRSTRY